MVESRPSRKIYAKALHFINMVIEGHSNALILKSKGGLGKSFQVVKALNDHKLKFNKDWVYLGSYSTALELYHFLYENRDKIIVVDDCEGLLTDLSGISILKSALWEVNGNRYISWRTTSEKLEAPKSFRFNGRLIFCVNRIPRKSTQDMQALLSRAHFYTLNLTLPDLLDLIRDIAREKYKDLTLEDRLKVADYICKKASQALEQLNLRTLIKSFDIYSYSKDPNIWQPLVDELMPVDFEKETVWQLLKIKDMSEMQKIKEFSRLTGRSKHTWYKLKAEILQLLGNKKISEFPQISYASDQ